ncbi:hypothetical protein SZ54_2776 [Rhizobium sp. UR51a]|nr:hypothetical protein SZ54_2776 [Rhizobium sp. UR51a]
MIRDIKARTAFCFYSGIAAQNAYSKALFRVHALWSASKAASTGT